MDAIQLDRKLQHLGFKQFEDYELTFKDGSAFISKWMSNRPQPQQAQIDAVSNNQANNANKNAKFKREFETNKKDAALITWIAGKHSLTYQEALAEIQVIRDAL